VFHKDVTPNPSLTFQERKDDSVKHIAHPKWLMSEVNVVHHTDVAYNPPLTSLEERDYFVVSIGLLK